MNRKVTDIIRVDTKLSTPIYKQIVQSVCLNIENGLLAINDLLPSVNKISEEFSLARGSVFTAFNELRSAGIIDSIPGKGYYVCSAETRKNKRIFLLFSTFTVYKETLFNALISHLPKTYTLDIYFHHHNIKIFETLIREEAGHYNTNIIIPEINVKTAGILAKLDQKNTFLLDSGLREFGSEYPGVFQNFENDIFSFLNRSIGLIQKYKRLFLIIPESIPAPGIIAGFNRFSKTKKIASGILTRLELDKIKKHDAFISIDDNHLVDLIQLVRDRNWELGKEVGVLSYNETRLKSVIDKGISTITADFEVMGKTMAEMVISGHRNVIETPFVMIDRMSF